MSVSRAVLVPLALVLSLGTLGCGNGGGQPVKLDPTPPMSGDMGWGVVLVSYVRLKAEPGYEAADSGVARRGAVIQVVARARAWEGRDRGTWFRVRGDDVEGWMHESVLAVHETRERALNSPEARP